MWKRRMSAPASSRSPQLDLLRGIAVLGVILCHYPYGTFFAKVGWAGVDLFFVLSGFLISGLLFTDWKKNSSFSIGRFFIRRGFKIYPAFYFFLLLTLPAIAVRYWGDLLPRFTSEALFAQDYFHHLWSHTWSLGVEEQFYLLLPLLLLVLSQLRRQSKLRGFPLIPPISVALLTGCLVLRLRANVSAPDFDPFQQLHLRADALFVGVALGYWFHFHGESFRAFSRWWLLPLGALFLAPLAVFGRDVRMIAPVFTCNSLGFGLLLCWILPRSAIRIPLIEKVGFYSYSIYLWHLLVTTGVQALPVNFFTFCVNIVACCAVGIYMATIVETRALALRERLFPAASAERRGPSSEIAFTAKPRATATAQPTEIELTFASGGCRRP